MSPLIPHDRVPLDPNDATRPARPGRASIRALGGPRTPARWELAAEEPSDAARCAAFLDRLEGMSRADWLAAGQRSVALGAAPSTALDAVLARRRLGVTAWLVRDAVETIAHVAVFAGDPGADRRGAAPPCSPAERATLEAARAAATRAALACLLQPRLARAQYVALLAPFLRLLADG